MIQFIDENGDHFVSVTGIKSYHCEVLKRSEYESQYGMDWPEDEDPEVCVFHAKTAKDNTMSFGVPFCQREQVKKKFGQGEDATINMERPHFVVNMTEVEFRNMVLDFDYEDNYYTEGEGYIDFGVRVSNAFFSKVEIYQDLDEVRKDLSENFPDGGRWFVSIMVCESGTAYCEMSPHSDYIGCKEPFDFKFKGSCLNAIQEMAKGIKSEMHKGR